MSLRRRATRVAARSATSVIDTLRVMVAGVYPTHGDADALPEPCATPTGTNTATAARPTAATLFLNCNFIIHAFRNP